MLQNAYFLAKIGADTAENEQHFAEICQKLATTLRVRTSQAGGLELEGLERLERGDRPQDRGLRVGVPERVQSHPPNDPEISGKNKLR